MQDGCVRVGQAHQPRTDIGHIGELGTLIKVDVVLHQAGAEQLYNRIGFLQTIYDQ
ncbi:hypothetical protein D3C80_2221770 [compost metagenome]